MILGRLKGLTLTGLVFSILSILAGAIVRATGSGNGCGTSWPTCNGRVLPDFLTTAALIEYTHRALSGTLLIITVALFIYSKKNSLARITKRVINLLLFFVVLEALIGMTIVLLEWVAFNTSLPRLIAVPIHLVNTFSLLALYIVTYCIFASGISELNFYYNRRFIITCILFFMVAVSGSIAALSDFLYPSQSFIQGLAMDFNETSKILTRLRVLHPIISSTLLGWIFLEAKRLSEMENISSATYLKTLVLIVASLGVINVFININIVFSVLHLFFADLLWCLYIYANMEKSYNTKKESN